MNGADESAIRIDGRCRGSIFTCPDSGHGVSITAMVRNVDLATAPMACAIYKVYFDAQGEDWGELLAYTEERDIPITGNVSTWFTFNFVSPPPLLEGEDYLIVGWTPNYHPTLRVTLTPGIFARRHFAAYDYPNFPNPHRTSELEEVTALIYCTYTVATPDCTSPPGWMGDQICGNPDYGQDPTHLYECTGTGWADLGYSSECDVAAVCINPPGNEGDTICGNLAYGQDPTHLYECQCSGGVCVWVDLGYSSDCDTTDCSSPPGSEGQIICGNSTYGQDPTHRYICQGGVWVDQGYSPACEPGGEIPWLIIGIVGAAVASAAIIGIALIKRK